MKNNKDEITIKSTMADLIKAGARGGTVGVSNAVNGMVYNSIRSWVERRKAKGEQITKSQLLNKMHEVFGKGTLYCKMLGITETIKETMADDILEEVYGKNE